MPKLIISHGDDSREVPLNSGDTLGRVPGNAVQLKIAEASRKHCVFTEEEGVWWIEDLGSSNGTLVNGRRVTKFELQDGDTVQVGVASLRFLMSEVEVEDEPEVEWGDDDISLEDEPYLILGGAGREGDVLPIPEGRLTIGRKARHTIQIKHASVSGDHAEIVREGDTVTLRDLGSSNGTFVGGRRIQDVELVPGDQVKFGGIPAVFESGNPEEADLSAVTVIDSAAATAPLEMAAIDGDATFEMHDMPREKETVWNILSVVLILGLGAGAFWLVTQDSKGGKGGAAGQISPAGNLVPQAAWSFETPNEDLDDADVMFWEKEAGSDQGESEEVVDPVLTGQTALAVRRPADEGPPTIAFLNRPITVSGSQAYRVQVSAIAGDDQVLPCSVVQWLPEDPEIDPDVEPIAVSRIFGTTGESDWSEITGVVTAPSTARFARLGVGVTRTGRAVFDNVSVLPVKAGPAGLITQVKGFVPVLSPQGSMRLSHFGRVVLRDVGLIVKDGKRVRDQDEMLWVSSAGDGAVVGGLRGGRGDVRTTVAAADGGISFVCAGPGLADAAFLALPLAVRADSAWQVTLLDGDKATRFEEPFKDQQAAELILGLVSDDGGDRVKIRFLDAEGTLSPRPISLAIADGRPRILVGLAGLSSLNLAFRLSFEAEEQEARKLLARARAAGLSKDSGVAIGLCKEVMARFPFVRKVEADAAALRDQLVDGGTQDLAKLQARVNDTLFFRTLSHSDSITVAVAAFNNRYKGTRLAVEGGSWRRS